MFDLEAAFEEFMVYFIQPGDRSRARALWDTQVNGEEAEECHKSIMLRLRPAFREWSAAYCLGHIFGARLKAPIAKVKAPTPEPQAAGSAPLTAWEDSQGKPSFEKVWALWPGPDDPRYAEDEGKAREMFERCITRQNWTDFLWKLEYRVEAFHKDPATGRREALGSLRTFIESRWLNIKPASPYVPPVISADLARIGYQPGGIEQLERPRHSGRWHHVKYVLGNGGVRFYGTLGHMNGESQAEFDCRLGQYDQAHGYGKAATGKCGMCERCEGTKRDLEIKHQTQT